MNNKETELYRIVDVVVGCCTFNGGEENLKQKVLSPCRDTNTVMTRCMLARMLAFAGYTNATISQLLHRSVPAVRNMLEMARDLRVHNKCYRIAEDEAMTKFTHLDVTDYNPYN